MMVPVEYTAELALPSLSVRTVTRRLAPAALLGAVAIAVVVLAGSHVHRLTQAVGRGLSVKPAWAVLAVILETASLAGYVALLSLVAGRATARVGFRVSAEITLAGTVATRLMPTAGAGGAALAVWSLRKAGLSTRRAGQTLAAFLVVLYSVFLAAIVVSGGALALGLVPSEAPAAVGATAAILALGAIALALCLARWRPGDSRSRLGRGIQLLGDSVRAAVSVLRARDPRVLGAAAYWLLDAAVVWAMLEALGQRPSLPVIGLAYFIGQLANTVPFPGSVTGGTAGALIAFGVPAGPALTAVLAYRAVSVWLPVPFGIAALNALRSNIASWKRADGGITVQGARPGERVRLADRA
jgi:uncharacterized membrane protein YbhN (UPF0104 family)